MSGRSSEAAEAQCPTISVVAPMFNEEQAVLAFVEAVIPVLEALTEDAALRCERWELLLVDDGSRDQTWERIAEASRRSADHGGVRGLGFARNFGHQAAIFAGMCEARGDAVITMDGDLQHPPTLIPELVRHWRAGARVVNTQRTDSEDTTAFKRLTSRWFYALFSRATGVSMSPGSSDFRLLDRLAVEALASMHDADLFIRGQVSWLGFRTATLPYQAARRHSGVSKFNLRKMLRFAGGAMLSFSLVPLRLGIWIGFLTSAFAFAELCYILLRYAQGGTVTGWASMMVITSFMFGVLFVLLGIIGLYLGKIYEILKSRPRYVIAARTERTAP